MRRSALFAVCVAFLLTVVADADAPVLHDFVPSLAEGDVALVIEGANDEPSGLLYEGEVISAPGGAPTREEEVQAAGALHDESAVNPPDSPVYRPDTLTGTHTATGYYEIFTPAIAPYKRMESYDRVELDRDRTPVLTVANATPIELGVVGTDNAASDGRPRDRFWGSVVVDFSHGPRAKIGSVSPESRILYVRTEPSTRVRFETDSAGNHYVVALGLNTNVVRVTFLTDAPQSYFNTLAPAIRTDAQAALVPRVPDEVREKALRFARELGISPSDPLRTSLDKLVEHFRGFQQSEQLPRGTGDIYLDLARGRVGVCRHRAYAFVVTALALGIPAHYLQNEAHAWVEVRLGDAGFMRIDLGGSSTAVEGHGLDDRPAYSPIQSDPFPQPEEFVRSYLSMQGQGTTPFSGVGDTRAANGAGGQGNGASPQNGASQQNGESPNGTPTGGPATSVTSAPNPNGTGTTGPDVVSAVPLKATTTTVDGGAYRVLRGRALELRGMVRDGEGTGLEGIRVDVYVVLGTTERRLGATVTGAGGRFEASVTVPQDLALGHHALRVRAAGDGRYAASVAD